MNDLGTGALAEPDIVQRSGVNPSDDEFPSPRSPHACREQSPDAHGADRPLQVSLQTGLTDFDKLRCEWEALESSDDRSAAFFQSYAWCRHVAEIRLARSASRYRLCIGTIRDSDDQLIGIWPLSLQRQGFCWIARSLDAPFGQFAGLLLREPADAAATIMAVARTLKSSGRVDGLHIDGVVEGSPISQGLVACRARVTRSDRSIHLDFREFGTFEDYHRTVATKTRKNLRNALNRMRRDHDVNHNVATNIGLDTHVIARVFDKRLSWMQLGGKTTPAFRDPDFRCLLEAIPSANPAIDLLGFELKTANETISTQWGFRYQHRYYAYMSARSLEFDEFSPGQVHLGMVIKACHELGIQVIELMAPASSYKLKWTKASKRIDDLSLALTPKGYLYLDIWHQKLRKLAKWSYNHVPTRLRRLLVPQAIDAAVCPKTKRPWSRCLPPRKSDSPKDGFKPLSSRQKREI